MSHLEPGRFYGDVREQFAGCDAVLSYVAHSHARALPAHTHGAPFFSLLLRGAYSEEGAHGWIDQRPLTLVFHPPETRHRDALGDGGASFFMIETGASWISRMPMRGPMTLRDDETLVALRLFHQQRAGALSALAAESALVELVAAASGVRDVDERASPRWLSRVVDRMRAEFARPLTVAALAHEANVHPVHLTRVFRRRFGATVGELVARLRVADAARAIVSGATLADAAANAGFADQSHLTRTFRYVLGTTPGALRKFSSS